MGRKATSTTKEDSNIGERLTDDHHYVTKITDGDREVEGRAKDAGGSQRRASQKWDDK